MLITHAGDLAVFSKDQRKQQGLSQQHLASQVGLKQATVSAFENNPDTTMVSHLNILMNGLHVGTLDRFSPACVAPPNACTPQGLTRLLNDRQPWLTTSPFRRWCRIFRR